MSKTKKLALIYILEILKEYTSYNHPLLQNEVQELLAEQYGIELEYKTISKNINLLIEEGFVQTDGKKQGCYYNQHPFEDSELQFLIQNVLSSDYLPASQAEDLIQRISKLSNRWFHPLDDYVVSTEKHNLGDNPQLFLNVERISDAIRSRRQIEYDLYQFDWDGNLQKQQTVLASPYTLFMHQQSYFLMAYDEQDKRMVFHRLDFIQNVQEVRKRRTRETQIKGYESGIDYERLALPTPHFTYDPVERIELKIAKHRLSDLYDGFGNTAKIIRYQTDHYLVRVDTSPDAMLRWALENIQDVEVLTPDTLRNRVKKALAGGVRKYKDSNRKEA